MAVGITISGLKKKFGALRALDGIDLQIEPGELFFLLGPSGCGKTTLLRSIAGFCIPDDGSIRIGETDVTRMPPHERDAGMVFQSYALWPHMTVKENVAFGLQQRRVSKAETARRTAEALAVVRMEDRADHRPNQLSGGQQQRVALARALVIHPRCLLLDEPLSNLDAKLRLDMRAEIRRICKEAGLTAIYVTHDQKEALSMADRLAVMDAGRVLQCGPPETVYRKPVNRFVAHFIGESNFIPATSVASVDGHARFQTPIGLLDAAAEQALAPGARVTLCLRPEDIRLSGAPPDGRNVFEGAIHDTAYMGELAQHRMDPDGSDGQGGPALHVFELPPRWIARDGRRVRVRAWIDPADVIVLPSAG